MMKFDLTEHMMYSKKENSSCTDTKHFLMR